MEDETIRQSIADIRRDIRALRMTCTVHEKHIAMLEMEIVAALARLDGDRLRRVDLPQDAPAIERCPPRLERVYSALAVFCSVCAWGGFVILLAKTIFSGVSK